MRTREEVVEELNSELYQKILMGEIQGATSMAAFTGPGSATYVLESDAHRMLEEFKKVLSEFFVDKIMELEQKIHEAYDDGYMQYSKDLDHD